MKRISIIFVIILLLYALGFAWYLSILANMPRDGESQSDAIVVLTGGAHRLDEAARLIEGGISQKYFISGVNQSVKKDKIAAMLSLSDDQLACCLHIGYQAENTVGNAIEVAQWVKSEQVRSIRLVTSLEHMPRAYAELKLKMGEVEIIRHPVGDWRPERMKLLSLLREYSKYLVSLLKVKLLA